jgi:hypothetical protein
MKLTKPKMTLAELRKNEPEIAEIIDKVILKYTTVMFEKSPALHNLGLEGALEETEGFFDDGLLKISYNSDFKAFAVGYWDDDKKEYVFPSQEDFVS